MKRRNLTSKKKIVQLKQSDIPEIREKFLKKQNGKCAICKKEAVRPCLDHEHKKRLKGSGLCRGVLCSNCNVFLAKMENNCVRYAIGIKQLPQILLNVVDYIQAEHSHYMHHSEKRKARKLKKSSYNKFKKLWLKEFSRAGRSMPNRLVYSKSGMLTKPLKIEYKKVGLKPEFYK